MPPIPAGTAYVDIRPSFDNYKRDVKKAGAATQDGFKGPLKNLQGRFKAFGEQGVGQLNKVGLAGFSAGGAMQAGMVGAAVAAGLAIAKFVGDAVNEFADLAIQVRDFSRATGIAVRESSMLLEAFELLGVDAGTAQAAMFKLGRAIATSGDKLAEFGVKVAKGRDGSVDLRETLLNLSDAYNSTDDATKRANLVFTAFGKSGAKLVPILAAGRQEIERLTAAADDFGTITESDIRAAEQLRISQRQLKDSFEDVKVAIGRSVVPALTEMLTTLNDTFKVVTDVGGKIKGVFDDLPGPIKTVVGEVVKSANPFHRLKQVVGLFGEDSKQAARNTAELEVAMEDAAEAAEEQAKQIEAVSNALVASVNSTFALKQAEDGLSDSHREAANKARDLAKAIKEHGRNSVEATEANEDYTDALRDVEGASLSLAGAQVRLKQDQAAAAGTTLDAAAQQTEFKNALVAVAEKLDPKSPLRAALQGYINTLATVPESVLTDIKVTVSGNARGFLAELRAAGVSPQLARSEFELRKIEGFQHGGVVRASPGGTLIRVGEGGKDEAIVPLSNVGAFGGSVNVTVQGSVITERQLKEVVRDGMLELKRRNGRAGLS